MDQGRLRAVSRLGAVAVIVLLSATSARAVEDPLVARGSKIVSDNCARCHAVGSLGDSPLPAAPPFRRLHERYEVEALSESLAEGLTVGHGPMPEWRFAPPDIAAIIAYLRSLQPSDARPCGDCGRSSPR